MRWPTRSRATCASASPRTRTHAVSNSSPDLPKTLTGKIRRVELRPNSSSTTRTRRRTPDTRQWLCKPRRGDLAGGIDPMSAICSHTDSIKLTELPAEIAGCTDCLAIGGRWLHLRMCQSCGHIALLRQLAEPACLRPRPQLRTPYRSLRRTRGRLELVLPRQRRLRGQRTHDAARACIWPTGARRRTPCTCTRRSSARSGSRPRRRATTGGTPRSTSTSAGSRPGACIIAARRSRSRSTSSTTPWSSAPPTGAPSRSGSASGMPVADFDARLHAALASSASTSRSRSSRSASR